MKIFQLIPKHSRWQLIAFAFWFGIISVPCFAVDTNYRINKGDKLKINVWQEENLQAEVMVSPDGTVSFPMVGVIEAAGKTIDEFQNLLKDKLEQFIPGPEVNVSFISVDGNLIYLIGEVAKPGPYTIVKDIDIMQALSMAGGITPFADKNDIRILRRVSAEKTESINFSYSDIEDGDNLESNILLQSGDTIIIP